MTASCAVCGKAPPNPEVRECSHIQCLHRHRLTAAPPLGGPMEGDEWPDFSGFDLDEEDER